MLLGYDERTVMKTTARASVCGVRGGVALAVVLAAACGSQDGKPSAPAPTGTVTDVDGNVYPTITIGKQEWMVANLKTTKYSDGSAIPNVTADSDWGGLASGAYAFYDNDAANKDVLGALYNWYAVRTGKLCPTGWSVPSDDNWGALAAALGGKVLAGGRMKEAGTAHWQSPNTGATNDSGFTALPAGFRDGPGSFVWKGTNAIWWSSSDDPLSLPPTSRSWDVDTISTSTAGSPSPWEEGYSIRCLRN
jgi:uncharacterized protein (TIGR02145 family)